MTESDRHIFLYAKGHYKITDQIEDMKTIIGERCGWDISQVSLNDINSILIGIAWEYINGDHEFAKFINNLNPNNIWRHDSEKQYDFDRILISNSLSVLRFQKVKDIPFKLGKPDPSILPLKEKEE